MLYPLPGQQFHRESLRAMYEGLYFFVPLISDLPEVVIPGSTIALCADHCKWSRIIDTVGDLDLF